MLERSGKAGKVLDGYVDAPKSRGVVMNPVLIHPMGGGEGRSSGRSI